MSVFFTSDQHFGDHRRLFIDRRPFASVAEMDEAMAARWNAAVRPEDTVWHLGDLTRLRKPERIDALLSGLNGRKHLIIGNNDGPATLAWPGWQRVSHYAELEVDGRGLVLCHYAFRTWNGSGRGSLNLHGHSHGRLRPMKRQFDVGVDVWDFTPATLDQILARAAMRA
ncbi:metallophosphoesterase [Enterovirga aerilata]|uniref:Metallophosphoesterase n=1 Tax=Enterovirga aerilata TaxID=2730920 RepID=A0A849I4E5_9HYPH|nr:metallophosphoesterase [Enterovirga sp. DB1703]NNM71249.1 metallophosphoesterase [Enterovirga sp. DB1703]